MATAQAKSPYEQAFKACVIDRQFAEETAGDANLFAFFTPIAWFECTLSGGYVQRIVFLISKVNGKLHIAQARGVRRGKIAGHTLPATLADLAKITEIYSSYDVLGVKSSETDYMAGIAMLQKIITTFMSGKLSTSQPAPMAA